MNTTLGHYHEQTLYWIEGIGIINHDSILKFIYSEKATNFCEISTVDLPYVVTVKSTVEILQDFVAFSEYMNTGILKFTDL